MNRGEVIRYPTVDLLTQKAADAQSVADALTQLAKAGRLGDLGREIAKMHQDLSSGRTQILKGPAVTGPAATALAKSAGSTALSKAAAAPASGVSRAEGAARQLAAAGAFGPLVKAEEYERRAFVVSDPQMRKGYLELAAQERQKAGV